MNFYINFLKLTGICNIIEPKNKTNDIQINVILNSKNEIEQHIINKNRTQIWKSILNTILNIIYPILILSLISWSFIYVVLLSIMNKTISYIVNDDISFIFIIQYAFGMYYYRSDHFKNIINTTKINNNKRFKIILICCLILNFILAIMSVILFIKGVNINIYTKLYVSKIISSIILFFDKFYKYNIFLSNIITFALVLKNHIQSIHSYLINLDMVANTKTEDLTLNLIVQDYNLIKGEFNESVSKLNNIFSSVTITGIIGSYFALISLSEGTPAVLIYVDLAYFFAIECIYIYTINMVRIKVNSIIDIINSQKLMEIFLNRNAFERFNADVYSVESPESQKLFKSILKSNSETFVLNAEEKDDNIKIIKEISLRNMIRINENSHSIDWLILNMKLNDKWDSFSFLGFEISDADMIKKLVSIIVGFLMLTNLNQILNVVQLF